LYVVYVCKEYADVIWDNDITYLVDKIEKVKMEAVRIVTGGHSVSLIDRSARLDAFR
jgi:hypothetical protein